MSLLSRALREIDARRSAATVPQLGDDLLGAYARARLPARAPWSARRRGGFWVLGLGTVIMMAMLFWRSSGSAPAPVAQPAAEPMVAAVSAVLPPLGAAGATRAPPAAPMLATGRTLPPARPVVTNAAPKRPMSAAVATKKHPARRPVGRRAPATAAAPAAAGLDVQPRLATVAMLQSQAHSALAAGQPDQAIALLRAALEQDPMAHAVRQALLAVLARGERATAWWAALAEAARVDSLRFGLLAARGLAEGGRTDEALALLQAVPGRGRDLDWHVTDGVLQQRNGQHERAIASLTRALEWAGLGAPKRSALQMALAESWQARGQTERARHQLTELIQSDAVAPELRALAAERLKSWR